jgi:hypothetical protein
MGKILFSLAFAAALLAVASSEASANFMCQAVGARSVGYGRAYFVADAAIAFRRIDFSRSELTQSERPLRCLCSGD